MLNTCSQFGWDRKTLRVYQREPLGSGTVKSWAWLIPLPVLLSSVKEHGHELGHLAVAGLFSWGFLCHPFDNGKKRTFSKTDFPLFCSRVSER